MQLSLVQVGAPSLLSVSYLECSFTDAAPYIHRRERDQGGHTLVWDLIAGVLPMWHLAEPRIVPLTIFLLWIQGSGRSQPFLPAVCSWGAPCPQLGFPGALNLGSSGLSN